MTARESGDPFARLNRLQEVLGIEDDKAVALLVSAYLEDLLGRLLAAFLLSGSASRALIYGPAAPLGSFSARIHAAHAMGLITDVQTADLHLLRKIRNTMAHSWEVTAIHTPQIADRVKLMSDTRLPDNPEDKAQNLSERLRQCVSCTMIELEVMIDQLGKGRGGGRLRPIALHLYPGPVEHIGNSRDKR